MMVDFRVGGTDLAPDPVGYGLLAYAASRLGPSLRAGGDPRTLVAMAAFAIAAFAAIPDFYGLADPTPILGSADLVRSFAHAAGAMLLLLALADAARAADRPDAAGHLRIGALANAAAPLASLGAALVPLPGLLLAAAMVSLLVALATAALLWAARDLPSRT